MFDAALVIRNQLFDVIDETASRQFIHDFLRGDGPVVIGVEGFQVSLTEDLRSN